MEFAIGADGEILWIPTPVKTERDADLLLRPGQARRRDDPPPTTGGPARMDVTTDRLAQINHHLAAAEDGLAKGNLTKAKEGA
jgi:hypothetical protein